MTAFVTVTHGPGMLSLHKQHRRLIMLQLNTWEKFLLFLPETEPKWNPEVTCTQLESQASHRNPLKQSNQPQGTKKASEHTLDTNPGGTIRRLQKVEGHWNTQGGGAEPKRHRWDTVRKLNEVIWRTRAETRVQMNLSLIILVTPVCWKGQIFRSWARKKKRGFYPPPSWKSSSEDSLTQQLVRPCQPKFNFPLVKFLTSGLIHTRVQQTCYTSVRNCKKEHRKCKWSSILGAQTISLL